MKKINIWRNNKLLSKNIISCFLAMTIFLLIPLRANAGWYDESEEIHSDTPYSEMQFTGFDDSTIKNAIDTIEACYSEEGHEAEIIESVQTILNEFDVLLTQKSLNSIRYYSDVNNEEYQKIDTELNLLQVDLVDLTGIALHHALLSPYYQAVADTLQDEESIEYYLDYEEMTQEEKDLTSKINDLTQQYDQASIAEYTYTDDSGKIWTLEALDSDPSLDSDPFRYLEISTNLAAARNEATAPIYLELVKLRNRVAQLNGYDNYAEYAYDYLYGRDYTTEDTKQLYEIVKKDFIPMLDQITHSSIEIMDSSLLDMEYVPEEDIIALIGKNMSKIDPALDEAYRYMETNHLYDIEYSEDKFDIGYTTPLYQYHCPFIFNCPDLTYYDYFTVVHEFGHYNNAYHNSKSAFLDSVNLDVAEIHSQGLELLYLDYCESIYGKESADSARMMIIDHIASSVRDGCLYDEFQNTIYSEDKDWTVDDINQLFADLSKEYGFNDYMADLAYYSWVDVSHTFQSPLYYISYATSALSALDIFTSSLHDRKTAINRYMELTTYGLDTPYVELMETCGMRDIFSDGTIKSIAADTVHYSNTVKEHAKTAASYSFLKNVIVGFVIFVIVMAILVFLLDLWLKKRQPTEPTDDCPENDNEEDDNNITSL